LITPTKIDICKPNTASLSLYIHNLTGTWLPFYRTQLEVTKSKVLRASLLHGIELVTTHTASFSSDCDRLGLLYYFTFLLKP